MFVSKYWHGGGERQESPAMPAFPPWGDGGVLTSAALTPHKSQITRRPALAERLRLVAGAGPVGPGAAPVLGALGGPAEFGEGAHRLQGVAGVVGDVGRDVEPGAGGRDAGEVGQVLRADEAAAVVAGLWPRVGVVDEDP